MVPIHEPENQASQAHYGKYAATVLANGQETTPDPTLLIDPPLRVGELWVEIQGFQEEEPLDPTGNTNRALQARAVPCLPPGFLFVPQVGATIWVEFAAGNINHPVWTGVWYAEESAPATVDDAQPTAFQQIIRTRSGHVIQLDDSENSEQLIITDATNAIVIRLDADGITIDSSGKAITVTCDSVDVEGNVNITGDVDITGAMRVSDNTAIEGDLAVGSGLKTTISGNEITGG